MFADAAIRHFGSGWVFLVADAGKQALAIVALPNHQCVTGSDETALLTCDVWEHAYSLEFQNRRADYVNAYWNVVEWDRVERRLLSSQGCEKSFA